MTAVSVRACGLHARQGARVAALAILAAGIFTVSPALGQSTPRDTIRRFTPEQWEQFRPLFALVEATSSGQPAPADVKLSWHNEIVKADSNLNFVPFTLTVAEGQFTSFPVAMYMRVVTRGFPARAPGPRDPLAQYPFEDATFFDKSEDGRFVRGFSAPPGRWDVYIAMREAPVPNGPSPKTVVFKRQIDLPDLTTDFSISSVVIADRIEPDPAPPPVDFEEQLDAPYRLWGGLVTPALDLDFRRSEKLSLSFAVYNTGATADDKPDLDIVYRFFQKTGSGETFFGEASPQPLNATTLAPGFSVAAGHLVIAGQDVPLARFADGTYRLQIAVTDKAGRKSLTRDLTFTVSGS